MEGIKLFFAKGCYKIIPIEDPEIVYRSNSISMSFELFLIYIIFSLVLGLVSGYLFFKLLNR